MRQETILYSDYLDREHGGGTGKISLIEVSTRLVGRLLSERRKMNGNRMKIFNYTDCCKLRVEAPHDYIVGQITPKWCVIRGGKRNRVDVSRFLEQL